MFNLSILGLQSFSTESYLDKDDFNGPGLKRYKEITGEASLDYAFFTIKLFSESSSPEDRKIFASRLPSLALTLGYKCSHYLFPLLEMLLSDVQLVRKTTLHSIPSIFMLFYIEYRDYHSIRCRFIPLLTGMLKEREMRKAVLIAFQDSLSYIPKADVQELLVPIVLVQVCDESDEEKVVDYLNFVRSSKKALGDICEFFFVPVLFSLSKSSPPILEAVVSCLTGLSRIVSPRCFSERCLKLFITLSENESSTIRKTCAEGIVKIFKSALNSEDQTNIHSLYQKLLNDKSKQVRNAALGKIGFYIVQSAETLPAFISKEWFKLANSIDNTDLMNHCAYTFPGVLDTVGTDNWEKMKKPYLRLGFSEKQCKLIILSSLPVISQIIGAANTEKDLVDFYLTLLNDSEDEVSKKAYSMLGKFLHGLDSTEIKSKLFSLLKGLTKHENWRFRYVLALQLKELGNVFDDENVVKELCAMLKDLIEDNIYKIQVAAAFSLGSLYENSPSEELKQELFNLFNHKSFYKRRLFLEALFGIKKSNFIEKQFGSLLNLLKDDPVSNIKNRLQDLVNHKGLMTNLKNRRSSSNHASSENSEISKETMMNPSFDFLNGPVFRPIAVHYQCDLLEFKLDAVGEMNYIGVFEDLDN